MLSYIFLLLPILIRDVFSESQVTTIKFEVNESFSLSQQGSNVKDLYVHLKSLAGNVDNIDRSNVLTDISFCFRFKLEILTYQQIFTIGHYLGIHFTRTMDGQGYINLAGRSYILYSWKQMLPGEWNHLCMAFDSQKNNNTMFIVLNGRLLFDDLVNLPELGFSIQDMDQVGLSLGFDPASLDPDVLLGNLFHGEITELYIWNKALSLDFMKAVTGNCTFAKSKSNQGDQGLILDFDSVDWHRYGNANIQVINIPVSQVCKMQTGSSFRFLPIKAKFQESQLICQSLGGNLWYPTSSTHLETEIATVKNLPEDPLDKICGNRFWLGLHKVSKVNHTVVTVTDNGTAPYFNWQLGQPNGRGKEGCCMLWSKISF